MEREKEGKLKDVIGNLALARQLMSMYVCHRDRQTQRDGHRSLSFSLFISR